MTTIEWTQETWNPITGCNKVSPGCAHCYAETLAKRFWGDRPFTEVRFHPERLPAPIKRRKPTTYFVNSMSDLFHPSITDEQLDQIFAVMALTPRHTYQVLTKRPERMLDHMLRWKGIFDYSGAMRPSYNFPLPNVWLGVTCENQKTADERIPLLLQTPAAVRFLSVEPQLEHVDLTCLHYQNLTNINALTGRHGLTFDGTGNKVDWVICGGESGAGARPFDLSWARSLRDQCKDSGVAFFMKQGGSNPIGDGAERMSGKGNDFEQLPPDLQIRQMPAGVMAS